MDRDEQHKLFKAEYAELFPGDAANWQSFVTGVVLEARRHKYAPQSVRNVANGKRATQNFWREMRRVLDSAKKNKETP